MQIYCKKCNKHTANTFPKKLVLLSKNEIKRKPRCAICLTERSFIDGIEYDLERALEIYLHFFTGWYYTDKDLLCVKCKTNTDNIDLKMFKTKDTSHIVKMKNTQSKIKPIKLGKRFNTTYCLGCKDYTHNFRPQEVKMTSKVIREKSHCDVCRSKKSRFLKQK